MDVAASAHEPRPELPWNDIKRWWIAMAARVGVEERGKSFFANALGPKRVLERVAAAGGDIHYALFVLLRYWIPPVLPPPGRERATKKPEWG